MSVARRLAAVGFAAALIIGGRTAPVAQATTTHQSGSTAFYLRYTCLCDSVPHAQEALDLASGYLDDVGPINGIGYPAGLLFALDSVIGAGGVNSALGSVADGVKITLIGVSQGAIVLNYVKQSLALQITANRPHTELSFVTFGDPTNGTGGIVAKNPLLWLTVPLGPLPTPYNTTEIVREYDGLADWPDRPTALSAMNALLGTVVVHPDYGVAADPRTPGTLKTVTTNILGGTTTHYLVPTAELPITALLRAAGMDTSLIDAWLRPQIDRSYNRTTVSAPATTTTTTEEPTAESTSTSERDATLTDTADGVKAVSPQHVSVTESRDHAAGHQREEQVSSDRDAAASTQTEGADEVDIKTAHHSTTQRATTTSDDDQSVQTSPTPSRSAEVERPSAAQLDSATHDTNTTAERPAESRDGATPHADKEPTS
ncbi:PE-PPE domain-containing protein [Mycolicibacterium sp. 22603]|uniref:PE-PPE domain-containing protein n=1 Tax=Mycolicibacterium sp. 22603 TaxID=3453950 RepID=UPI003F862CDB